MYQSRRTADPVADAEANATDTRPLLGECAICRCEIHGSDSTHYADEAYYIDGEYICSDHLHEFFKDFLIE